MVTWGKHITVSMSECTQMIRANPAALFEQRQRVVVSTTHCWLFEVAFIVVVFNFVIPLWWFK